MPARLDAVGRDVGMGEEKKATSTAHKCSKGLIVAACVLPGCAGGRAAVVHERM
jgi:hypothetical protein